MGERYNAYLYLANTTDGNRIILAEHVTYAEAEAACRSQLIYLPKCGRIDDTWYSAGMLPRLAIADVEHEPVDFLSGQPARIEQVNARIRQHYVGWGGAREK